VIEIKRGFKRVRGRDVMRKTECVCVCVCVCVRERERESESEMVASENGERGRSHKPSMQMASKKLEKTEKHTPVVFRRECRSADAFIYTGLLIPV
jgi:hypothetical protein